MRFRFASAVAALLLASTAVATEPPDGNEAPGTSDTDDIAELGQSLLKDAKSSRRRPRKQQMDPAVPASPRPLVPPKANTVAAAAEPPGAGPVPPASAPAARPPETGSAAALPTPHDGGTLPERVDDRPDGGTPQNLLPTDPPPLSEPSGQPAEADGSAAPLAAEQPPTSTEPKGTAARDARVRSGKNYPMQGAAQSPLARLGVPPQAVPAVATAAVVGAMAFWPFLLKTLTGLLKGVLTGRLKVWGKKDKKIDETQRAFTVLGFKVRPKEIGSLLLAGLVYGLAICYTLKGWRLNSPFVLQQETIVLCLYFLRSSIRFLYERMFGLVTQFRFWPGGSLLCLVSALLGNTLATVGYEFEAAKGPAAAERAVRLKVSLILLTLCMALGFFFANWLHPMKVLQSGRIMASGVVLAEILPITPMPGQKIYAWRRRVWALLFVLIVPTFFLINFFL